jgi:HEPN domain-containing protein
MAHLALEKFLKAKVCRQTGELAPRLHNLVRLSELAELDLTAELLDTLADLNDFNLEGRYPEEMAAPPTAAESKALMARTKKVIEWLTREL